MANNSATNGNGSAGEAPPRLSHLRLQPEYRSDSNDLVSEFYLPCLGRSTLYRRAVGYFTSSGLALAAQGLASLIRAGGQMQLVASPQFTKADLDAIRAGYVSREESVTESLVAAFDQIETALVQDQLAALAFLVAHGKLDVRIAVPIDADGALRPGIYHEKLGIFNDAEHNVVVFTGSPNETAGGLVSNFEAIDVFCSWMDVDSRVPRKVQNFERLWENKTKGLSVIPFPEAARRKLLSFYTPKFRSAVPNRRWAHQEEALACFLRDERGVLEMATGTGKTRTALAACHHLVGANQVDTIIVAADGTDLLEQWYGQLVPAARTFHRPFSVHRHYKQYHEHDRFLLNPTKRILLASRPSIAPAIARLTPQQATRTLLIHDEVHRLGSPANRQSLAGLSDSIRYRLGLSATPEREYDATGTEFITQHIGPVIFRFGLEDAIRRGILTPFTYTPLCYDLTDEDRQRLQAVYKKAEARARAGEPMTKEEVWIELAKVHKTSRAKLPLFLDFVRKHPEALERCIIFVETMEYGDEVLEIIHRFRHDFHTYYSGEDSETLRRFAEGDIQCMITCHRLSEGIDIKTLRNVFLFASARAPLETIQRIGRCLRADPANPSKRAWIIDFVRNTEPNNTGADLIADDARRLWLDQVSRIEPLNEDF